MEKQELKHLLDVLQEFEDSATKWITPEYTDPLYQVIELLLEQVFTEHQLHWINWWMWETNFGRKKHLTGTQKVKSNDEFITVNSFDNLWKALNV